MARALGWLYKIEAALAVIAYVAVTGLLLAAIIARELFSTSIWGSEKAAVFAAIFAAFFGLTLSTAANTHLRPQFTDNWWPRSVRPVLARVGDYLSAVLFIIIGIVACIYVADTYVNEDKAMILYWPLWVIQIVIPYAFFSSALRHLVFALNPGWKPSPEIVE